jgi:hypothetical protein
MRGFPRYGELTGAAVACNKRSLQWAEGFRAKLYEAIRGSRRSALDVEDTIRVTAELEAYALRQGKADPREYCSLKANVDDLTKADAIVQGAERLPPVPREDWPQPRSRT